MAYESKIKQERKKQMEELSQELSTIPKRRTPTSPNQSLPPSPFLFLLFDPLDPPYLATNRSRQTKEVHGKQEAKE